MRSKLEFVSNSLRRNERDSEFEKNLTLIRNEIRKELALTPRIEFEYLDALTPDKVTPEIIASAQNYIELLRRYYIDYYNYADGKRNALIEKLEKEEGNSFLKLRDKYHNKALEEFVLDKNETTTLIEYKGELVQKMDPIFLDPQHRFIKAHFYAPTKQVFGIYIDTYIMNIIILWVITIVFYLVLYFRLLKRLLDLGEILMRKKITD